MHEFNPFEFHPFSEICPLLVDGRAFDALVANIAANGQSKPIMLYQGKILDGRRRVRACGKLGIEPRYEVAEFASNSEAIAAVIRMNVNERLPMISDERRAFVAARYVNFDHAYKFYQVREAPTPLNRSFGRSVRAAAALLNVSPASVDRARAVIANAPELEERIVSGQLSLSTIAERVRKKVGPRVMTVAERMGVVQVHIGRSPKKAQARAAYERGLQQRRAIPKMRGLTKAQVDPDFVETTAAGFSSKYGHVLTRTKDEIDREAAIERADKLVVWLGQMPAASATDLAAWVTHAKNDKDMAYRLEKLTARLSAAASGLAALGREFTVDAPKETA